MADVKNIFEYYRELYTTGLKLTHQFQLSLSNSGLPSIDKALEKVTMFCHGAQVPGRLQNTTDVQYLGYPFQYPTNMTMTNELQLTINADAELKVRDALLAWMTTITDADIEGGSAMGGIKTLSTASARLDLYDDKMETIVHTFKLAGIYPTEVGVIEMSNIDPTVAQFTANFKYQYWTSEKTPNDF